MNRLFAKTITIVLAMMTITMHAQTTTPSPYGPVPTEDQLQWQDMEMYAFIHYSLNTYTDQEWGVRQRRYQVV